MDDNIFILNDYDTTEQLIFNNKWGNIDNYTNNGENIQLYDELCSLELLNKSELKNG